MAINIASKQLYRARLRTTYILFAVGSYISKNLEGFSTVSSSIYMYDMYVVQKRKKRSSSSGLAIAV